MRATGIGTDLSKVELPFRPHVALIKPCEGVLTREVYAALDLSRPALHKPSNEALYCAITQKDYEGFIAALGNRLQDITQSMRPGIKDAIAHLKALGADAALMSGSGPTVFGLFKQAPAASAAVAQLTDSMPACYSTGFSDEGVHPFMEIG